MKTEPTPERKSLLEALEIQVLGKDTDTSGFLNK